MRAIACLLALLVSSCVSEAPAPASGPAAAFDPYAALADPELPARRLPGSVHLSSSRQPGPFGARPENRDFNQFVRVDGDERVFFEADGPGVITRIWLTIRDGSERHETGDTLPVHVYVDGAEIDFGAGRGTTLEALTSGAVPALPGPWVAGRDRASDGYIIAAPIAFAGSIRLTLEADGREDLIVYHQVDWRRLPAGTAVRSFDGTLTADERAALDAATALWVDGARPVEATVIQPLELAPGAVGAITIEGPTVVHSLAAEASPALVSRLVVDGVTVAETPLSRWLGASEPAGLHDSAMSAFDGTRAALRLPIPVASELRWEIRNEGDATVALTLEAAHDPAGFDPELGRLRAECGAETHDRGLVPVLDAEGPGQYVGQHLVVRGVEAGWWFMEGDHRIRVDGVETALGTGIEDYFGGAFYYLRGPFSLPLSGATGFDFCCRDHLGSGRVSVAQYRLHLLGAVPFERRLQMDYEGYVDGTTFERCAFFYTFR